MIKKTKYKVDDKVRIKTWKAMKNEFIMSTDGDVSIRSSGIYISDSSHHLKFSRGMENFLRDLNNGRIVTISEIIEKESKYRIKENSKWVWSDEMIENLEKKIKPIEKKIKPIENRFEILDL